MKNHCILVYKKVKYDTYRDVYEYRNWNIEASFADGLFHNTKNKNRHKDLEEFILKLYWEYHDDGTISGLLKNL